MDSQTTDYIKLILGILGLITGAGITLRFVINKTSKSTSKNTLKNNQAGGDIAGGNIYKK